MKKLTLLIAGMMLMLGASSVAQALTLTLSSGAQTVLVNDNGALDYNPTVDNILYTGTINGISVSYATGTSAFSPTLGTFDIGSMVFKGAGTISILLSDSGLALNTLAISPNISVVQNLSDSSSSASSKVTADVKINGVSVPGILSALTGTSAATTSGVATVGDTFSLDELINIALGNNPSSVSLDGLVEVSTVPEPCTMLLFGIGLVVFAVYSKRRMNKEA